MKDGTIIKSGGCELVDYIEEHGYDNLEKKSISSTCIMKENLKHE